MDDFMLHHIRRSLLDNLINGSRYKKKAIKIASKLKLKIAFQLPVIYAIKPEGLRHGGVALSLAYLISKLQTILIPILKIFNFTI
jgi:hypothetical protein